MTYILNPKQIEELKQLIEKHKDLLNSPILYNLYLQDNIFIDIEDMIDRNILSIEEFKDVINKYKTGE